MVGLSLCCFLERWSRLQPIPVGAQTFREFLGYEVLQQHNGVAHGNICCCKRVTDQVGLIFQVVCNHLAREHTSIGHFFDHRIDAVRSVRDALRGRQQPEAVIEAALRRRRRDCRTVPDPESGQQRGNQPDDASGWYCGGSKCI